VTTAAGFLDAIQHNVNGSATAWANTTQGKLQSSQVAFNEAVEKIGYQLLPVLSTIMQKFADDWLPALGRGWQKVTDFMRPFLDLVGNIIGAIGNLIDSVKKALAWLDQLKGQSEFYHPKAPGNVPGHAAGGWVGLHGPEMAIVGERGPEYIVPNNALARSHGNMSSGVFHSHDIIMDGKKVADAVGRRQFYGQRRTAASSGRV
jgi:hypothetical protein